MSNFTLDFRHGLGVGVDPHLDVRMARANDTNAHLDPEAGLSGYFEFGDPDDIGSAWRYVTAFFREVYGEPGNFGTRVLRALGLTGAPVSWTHVARLGFLTSDRTCGLAIPLAAFDVSANRPLGDVLNHLRGFRGPGGKGLEAAQRIGLTVVFRLQPLAQALKPATKTGWPVIGSMFGGPREMANYLMKGGDRPLLAGMRAVFGGEWPRRPFDAQDIGVSSSLSPMLKRAARDLRFDDPGPPRPTMQPQPDPLDYGLGATGKGVIVGVVDFGCDFAHRAFRNGSTSRILKLWDQNAEPATPLGDLGTAEPTDLPFGYGRVWDRADISDALAQWQGNPTHVDPYQVLGYDPHAHHFAPINANDGAHGTAVLEVAAGGCRPAAAVGQPAADRPRVRGVACDADIVFVQVRQHPKEGPQRELQANDVLDGVAFIFQQAERLGRPCVVNLSLNTMSGPHDGDGYFERRLADLLRSGTGGAEALGRSVVIAAGNVPSRNSGRWQHLSDVVTPDCPFSFVWSVPREDQTRNSLEVWYDATESTWLAVSLQGPQPESGAATAPEAIPTLGPVQPGEAARIRQDGTACGDVIGSRARPTITSAGVGATDDHLPGRHVVLIELDANEHTVGRWTVTLSACGRPHGPPPTDAITLHAWLERDDGGQSGLQRATGGLQPVDEGATLGTLSCGPDAVVVTAYNTATDQASAWALSSQGPRRVPAQSPSKPDLAAPGCDVWLIRSKQDLAPRDQFARFSGTSIAAPFVTGVIACLYERWPALPLATLKNLLTTNTRPPPGNAPGAANGWTPAFGHGLLAPGSVWQAAVQMFPPSPAPLPITTPPLGADA